MVVAVLAGRPVVGALVGSTLLATLCVMLVFVGRRFWMKRNFMRARGHVMDHDDPRLPLGINMPPEPAIAVREEPPLAVRRRSARAPPICQHCSRCSRPRRSRCRLLPSPSRPRRLRSSSRHPRWRLRRRPSSPPRRRAPRPSLPAGEPNVLVAAARSHDDRLGRRRARRNHADRAGTQARARRLGRSRADGVRAAAGRSQAGAARRRSVRASGRRPAGARSSAPSPRARSRSRLPSCAGSPKRCRRSLPRRPCPSSTKQKPLNVRPSPRQWRLHRSTWRRRPLRSPSLPSRHVPTPRRAPTPRAPKRCVKPCVKPPRSKRCASSKHPKQPRPAWRRPSPRRPRHPSRRPRRRPSRRRPSKRRFPPKNPASSWRPRAILSRHLSSLLAGPPRQATAYACSPTIQS